MKDVQKTLMRAGQSWERCQYNPAVQLHRCTVGIERVALAAGAERVATVPPAGQGRRTVPVPPTSAAPNKDPSSMKGRSHPHILVIDEEPMIQELIARVLGTEGLEVRTVDSGYEAVDLFQHDSLISLAILDWHMPGLTAEETFDRLVAIRPDLKVIVATGDDISDVEDACFGRPVFTFLPKPFDIQGLVSVVKAALAAGTACQ